MQGFGRTGSVVSVFSQCKLGSQLSALDGFLPGSTLSMARFWSIWDWTCRREFLAVSDQRCQSFCSVLDVLLLGSTSSMTSSGWISSALRARRRRVSSGVDVVGARFWTHRFCGVSLFASQVGAASSVLDVVSIWDRRYRCKVPGGSVHSFLSSRRSDPIRSFLRSMCSIRGRRSRCEVLGASVQRWQSFRNVSWDRSSLCSAHAGWDRRGRCVVLTWSVHPCPSSCCAVSVSRFGGLAPGWRLLPQSGSCHARAGFPRL